MNDKTNAYDLALLYAKVKLENEIKNDSFDGILAPKHIEEMDYLADAFNNAYGYYKNFL